MRETDDASNPLIMPIGAGPHDYATGVGMLLAEPAIDALMVFYVDVHEGDPDAVLETISMACAGQPKPAVASVVRRRTPATAHARRSPQLLVPGILCERARQRG